MVIRLDGPEVHDIQRQKRDAESQVPPILREKAVADISEPEYTENQNAEYSKSAPSTENLFRFAEIQASMFVTVVKRINL